MVFGSFFIIVMGLIKMKPSHNYYLGRAEADITRWIDYFCQGMADAFEKVLRHMKGEDLITHLGLEYYD